MRAFLGLALFPLGMLVMVMLIALGPRLGLILLPVWGFIVLPLGARWLLGHSAGGREQLREMETNYWRISRR